MTILPACDSRGLAKGRGVLVGSHSWPVMHFTSLLPLESAQEWLLRCLNDYHNLHGRQQLWHVSSATWCLVCIETVPAECNPQLYSLLSAGYLIGLLPCVLMIFLISSPLLLTECLATQLVLCIHLEMFCGSCKKVLHLGMYWERWTCSFLRKQLNNMRNPTSPLPHSWQQDLLPAPIPCLWGHPASPSD